MGKGEKREAAAAPEGESPAKKHDGGCPVSKADFLVKAEEHTFKLTLHPKEFTGGTFGWSKAGGRSNVELGASLGNEKVLCSGPSFNCVVHGAKDGSCGLTSKQFMKAAGDKEFEMKCLPYEFSTGSLGWQGHSKESTELAGKTLQLECNLNCPIMNSNSPEPPPPPLPAATEKVDFETIGRATEAEKDDLKKINGIGPFIERKCNGIGIYTFKQISLMTPKIEDDVNEAIEYFIGRIRRDDWVGQAKVFAAKKKH